MSRIQRGFTLIELMIVVAIIGILAAIAIPAYQHYTIRAQVSEGLSVADGVKVAIAENYAQTGVFPADLTAAGITANPSGTYVTGVTVNMGEILVTYGGNSNAAINGEVLALLPGVDQAGDVLWQCGKASKPTGNGVTWNGDAAADTTIDAANLPSSCRS